MKIVPFLPFFFFICTNISAQQLKIDLTNISFSDKFNFLINSPTKTDSVFIFLKEKGLVDFMKSNSNPVFLQNKKNLNFDYKYSNIPAYKPVDRIDNYRYLENKITKECQFCGVFEGLLGGW